MRTIRLATAIGTLLLVYSGLPLAFAQTNESSTNTAPAADVNRRIAELEQQVKQLTAEIRALKQPATPAPVAAAVASPQPEASPAAKPDPLGSISSVIGGATLTGLVDTYYTYNVNQPANRVSGFRLFDNNTNQFSLNLIELGLVKAPEADSRLGYNLTLGFGNAMNVVNGSDPAGLGFAQYLKEGYLSYLAPIGKGLQIDAGKFVTPNGAEVIESNANWNYSRSLLFNYAIPFYHFGLRAKYAFNDKYALTGYVVNGWNNILENYSNGKTGGLSFVWTPNKKLAFTENWMGGPGATLSDNNDWRNLSDTVITYSPNSKLSLMVNGDYGRSESFNGAKKPSEWYGVAGYAKYQFNPLYAVATRYEYYNDPEGVTTGFTDNNDNFVATRQHIQEVTGTFERRFAQHLITRLEFRHDMSNQRSFLKGNRPVLGQSTIAGGLIFVLEPPR